MLDTSFSRVLHRSRSPLLLALVFLVTSIVAPAFGQTDPNLQRGFSPDKAYDFGSVDSVNLFNGNLTLALPLGGVYPKSESLDFGLGLVYNSNVWDFETVYRRISGIDQSFTQALPDRESNAGLGWRLSLGKVYPPGTLGSGQWRYVGPDGAEHVFYGNLHQGEATTTNFFYSRDGSYLRLEVLAFDDDHQPLSVDVELPNGRTHTFTRTSATADFRLGSIRDLFGNQISVYYNVANQWRISDGIRDLYVDFETRSNGDVVVKQVNLAAFGTAARAYYTFAYTDVVISRSCQDTDPEVHGGTPTTAAVTLLSSVTAWDGSRYAFDTYNTTCYDGATEIKNLPGTLAQMTLPTLGKLAWTYQTYTFPTRGGGCGQSGPGISISGVTGIKTKRVLNAAGSCETWDGIGCQWTYTPQQIAFGRRKVTVALPTGDQVVHYFAEGIALSKTTWTGWEYGLPFDPGQTDGDGRFLSQEIYDGATKVRSIYVRHEHDKLPDETCNPDRWYNTNRRVASEKTVYHDDGGKYAEVTRSSFDGLGHYRQTDTTGSFGTGDLRSSYVDFNPERGTYSLDPATNGFTGTYTPWPSDRNWVLGTAQSTSVTEGGQTAKSDFCYAAEGTDALTGQLLRTRVMKGSSPGVNDLVTSYVYSFGNRTEEHFYGGDTQSLGTTANLCNLSLPADAYFLEHTHSSGVRATSRWQTTSGTDLAGGTILEQGIDPNTGLPSWVRDGTGLQTDLTYDPMGRLTWEKPGSGAWTQYQWTRATSSTALANVLVRQRPTGSTSATLAQSRIYFDAHGRPWRDQVLGANGTWSTVDTTWNSMGWKRSVTERQPVSPTKWTTFKDFDPFGRPRLIQPADGTAHNVTLSYQGVRVSSRTVPIKTGTTETSSTTTERYDRQGRLWQVVEPSGTGGTNVTTTYGYDVAGRLSSVSIAGQTRTFTYDNRGFLNWERHPEKGASGHGYVRYLGYDALGNPGRKLDAVASQIATTGAASDLDFDYDRASRLTRVREASGQLRVLKEFVYGISNPGGSRQMGKVVTADRYNYIFIGTTPFTVQVRESYTYAGTGGAVSNRSTQLYVNGGAQEAFTQAWSWNDLGDPVTVTQPSCVHAACLGSSAATPRNVGHQYTNGFLTGVTGYASSITYHPNGLVNQVVHANGVTWTQAADPNGMARPASFSTSGASSNWTSGSYAFDGAGNVASIGSSAFTYDPVSRLTASTVYTSLSGTSGARTQSATFDSFGNITSLTTQGSTLSTLTSTSTNRLSGAGFDSMGSMTSWNGNTYEYDAFGMTWRMTASGVQYHYLYTADDERIWTFQPGAPSRWTLRDLDGRVLREMQNDAGTWTVPRDYVYRDAVLLAAVTPTETTHFHPDHLGSPRLVTGNGGAYRAYHVYHPFGTEATSFSQDSERMKFTGHERDLANPASTADDLDYMHARFYNMQIGRFLSFDPSSLSIRSTRSQSWNRYSYVLNNPLKYIDPSGEAWFNVGGEWTFFENTDYIEEITVHADGTTESKTVKGLDRLVAFDGAALTLYHKDGSRQRFGAVSGQIDAAGRTQPGLQSVRNVGPIPEGRYSFNPATIQSFNDLPIHQKAFSLVPPQLKKVGEWPGGVVAWGKQRVELTPSRSTNTYGRTGFFIHGGSYPGSAGCIDLCGAANDFFSAVPDIGGEIPVFVQYP